jgi:hypothetical protein
MPCPTLKEATDLSLNHKHAPDAWAAACVALPAMIQHLGLELSAGFLRDVIVRKDRLTSGLAGPHGGPYLELIYKKLFTFKDVVPQSAKDLTAERFIATKGGRSSWAQAKIRSCCNTDLANRTFVLYLVFGLACRGIGSVDGKSNDPCGNSIVFDFSDEAARFEFDHWPETQDQLRELTDIAFRISKVSYNYTHGYMDIVNLICTSPRCNQCHQSTSEKFKKAALAAAAAEALAAGQGDEGTGCESMVF